MKLRLLLAFVVCTITTKIVLAQETEPLVEEEPRPTSEEPPAEDIEPNAAGHDAAGDDAAGDDAAGDDAAGDDAAGDDAAGDDAASSSAEGHADDARQEDTPQNAQVEDAAEDESAKSENDDWRFVGSFSLHGSLLSSAAGRSTLDLTYGAALRFGARRGQNQLNFVIDYSGWQSLEDRTVITFATLNLAAEYTRTFFGDVIAVSLAAGPSVLLTDTLLDDAGSVGLFIELRPAGFRWRTKYINIGVDPLSFTVVAPVLGALPLVRVQYRTTVTLEFRP